MPRRVATRGFTLIELIVVILLIALAVSVTAFSMSSMLESARVKAASRDLVAALRFTRGQAIVQRESQALEIDVEARSFTVPGRKPVEFPRSVEVKLLTARSEQIDETRGRIRFYRDGSSTGGNVRLIAGEREWRVDVAWLTGEVNLREVQL
ncbi:MAG TPA: GspH/FimT family pseudopilin [Xanthomonadaceae bacterium]|nr:GspH/FimT family pseudopilin [Xanthomonadaceae bacterium]